MKNSNLIRVPNEKLLEEERARCAKLAGKLEEQKEKLRRSREEWEPAYKQWYSEEIAPLAAKARELLLRARDQRELIRRVEEAARVLYCTPREARPKVESALRGHVIFQELEHEYYEGRPFPRGALHPDVEMFLRLRFARQSYPMKNPERLEELFQVYKRALLEKVFHWEEEPADHATENARLKCVFRELARRLHPDANAAAGARENELWHEVTAAFRGQDLETLESILATLDSGARFEAVDSLGRLRAIMARIETKLRAAKSETRAESRTPWWKFGKAKNREKLSRTLREEQEQLIRIAEAEIEGQALRMQAWERGGT